MSVSADVFDPVKRSQIMACVKGANTKPEVSARSQLHRAGFRFRLHRKDLPGRPDIVLPGLRTVIFVHGCFWHGHPGCKHAALPKGNLGYWTKKIGRNVERDKTNQERLAADGWNVEVLWECEIKRELPKLIERLQVRRMALRQTTHLLLQSE